MNEPVYRIPFASELERGDIQEDGPEAELLIKIR
jgi:hypothetical protein